MPRSMRLDFLVGAWAATAMCLGFAPRFTSASELDKITLEVRDIEDNAGRLGALYLKTSRFKSDKYVAERLVDGENFYRIKDYQRSAIIFLDIVENYSTHAAYPDALFLYADSLFLSGDYLTSKDVYEKFLQESSRPGAARFKEKAVARLIEIAIHLGAYEGVESYFDVLGQSPSEAARYVKGKFLYFKGERGRAYDLLSTVTKNPTSLLKARYLMGVILTVEEKYPEAVEIFSHPPPVEAVSAEAQEVLDLMSLGAGRLLFELGRMEEAAACYKQIDQSSKYFDAALYEAASVQVQAGDVTSAEQTLEVLTVSVPDSRFLPRARMLRGNLLLRTGKYDEAEALFDEVVDAYTPVMSELDGLIGRKQDTRQFFLDLVEGSVSSLDMEGVLPPLAAKWIAEEPEVSRALELAKELGTAKGYIKETERLIMLLDAVLQGPARINAVPILRQGKRRAQQLSNRLCQLRSKMAELLEDELGDAAAVEALRGKREGISKKVSAMPVSPEAFAARERASKKVFLRMRAELQRNLIRLDRLGAMIVAVERFVGDPRYMEGVAEENITAVRQELGRHRYNILEMQQELAAIRSEVEKAGYRIGVGDNRDKSDASLRKLIHNIAEKERAMCRATASRFCVKAEAVFRLMEQVEKKIALFEREAEAEARRQVDQIRAQVERERKNVAVYHREIEGLGNDAEEVVGGVAFENFSAVRKRFHDLVLKADVGIIDVAWLRKEEHTSRISEYTDARLKEIKSLDDEFQEIRDLEKPESE